MGRCSCPAERRPPLRSRLVNARTRYRAPGSQSLKFDNAITSRVNPPSAVPPPSPRVATTCDADSRKASLLQWRAWSSRPSRKPEGRCAGSTTLLNESPRLRIFSLPPCRPPMIQIPSRRAPLMYGPLMTQLLCRRAASTYRPRTIQLLCRRAASILPPRLQRRLVGACGSSRPVPERRFRLVRLAELRAARSLRLPHLAPRR